MIADVPLSYEDLVNLVSTLSDGDLEFTVGQPLYDKLLDARNRVAPRRSGRNACVILCSDLDELHRRTVRDPHRAAYIVLRTGKVPASLQLPPPKSVTESA